MCFPATVRGKPAPAMLVPQPSPAQRSRDAVDKLRRLIRRKTSEKARLLKDIADCEALLAPLAARQEVMEALDRELHAQFREAINNPKLSKRAQRQVRQLYQGLQRDEVISPDPTREKVPEKACTCPACSARAAGDDAFEDMFGNYEPPPLESGPPRPAKKERDAGLRALYHKLAFRFHPDRA